MKRKKLFRWISVLAVLAAIIAPQLLKYVENNVYTIKEFAETEGEIDPRFGGGDEVYEEVYQELVVLLDVIKRKIGWR